GWWAAAGLIGLWLGRRAETSPPIATLLASARSQPSLPEVNPARVVLNRLWPLLISTLGAGALGVILPQVPAIAAGFAITWALAARRAAAHGIASHRPRVLVYCSITAALLWPRPGVIWVDAIAAENRPGRHGVWQRVVERRRLAGASLVMTMAPDSLAPLVPA